jgi:hypothetical protein
LREGTVRGARAREARDPRLQLLDLLEDRVPAPHRLQAQLQAALGRRRAESYTFNTGTAKHLFCSVCGVKSFYVPRSHPDGYSVNVRCLDEPIPGMAVKKIDGRNWEAQFPEGHGTPPPD